MAPLTTYISSPIPCSATVNQLFVEGDTEWNIILIRLIFLEVEAKTILGIPIGPSSNEDKMIWALTER